MHHGKEPSPPGGESFHRTSVGTDGEEHRDRLLSLEGELVESDQHVARLQQMLQHEREKGTRLQLQCNQQEAELRQKEQLCNRLKERLSLLTDKHKQRGLSIEVLNLIPGGRGRVRRDQAGRSSAQPNGSVAARQETAALRLMLERQGAELREAMKLRHRVTTLLHALRVNMQQTVMDCRDEEDVHIVTDKESLVQSELALGEHVTGGVVQGWLKVQKRIQDFTGNGVLASDQDKLLLELETELKASQELIRLQQQMLHDSLFSPALPVLEDSYFLEEWERLHLRWAELTHHRRTFERERHNFTEAAIKLSRERLDFNQQKGSLLKRQFLCDSPWSDKGQGAHGSDRGESTAPDLSVLGQQFLCDSPESPLSDKGQGAHGCDRAESTAVDLSVLGPMVVPGCCLLTASPKESQISPLAGFSERWVQQKIGVQTPATPDLYSALGLSYSNRVREDEPHADESCNDGSERMLLHTPRAQNLERSF